MSVIWLNGTLVDEVEAKISPFDRGLLLGDGVFETLRAYAGRPHALDAHLARLRHGCAVLRLPFPDGLPAAVDATLRANALSDAAVRITLTRGPGGRGASPRGAGPPTVLVTAQQVPAPVPFVRAVTTRGHAPAVPGVKTLAYAANIVARLRAEDAGADDALFVDDAGRVIEATQANVFAFVDGGWVTPPLASGCLPGVTRAAVLALAGPAREAELRVSDLLRADEACLTASVSEIVPLVQVDGAPLGNGKPGARTLALHAAYRKQASRIDAKRNG